MSKLNEDQMNEIEGMDDEALVHFIATNERKRRRIQADQKAYAKTCNEFCKELDAKTTHAIEQITKREVERGAAPPPSPMPVLPFPLEGSAKKKAKASEAKGAKRKKAVNE